MTEVTYRFDVIGDGFAKTVSANIPEPAIAVAAEHAIAAAYEFLTLAGATKTRVYAFASDGRSAYTDVIADTKHVFGQRVDALVKNLMARRNRDL
jgi:hypothetical protein